VSRFIALQCSALFKDGVNLYIQPAFAALLIFSSAWASFNAAPYYRLYTNALGGGRGGAGNYFPQDEFYDGYMAQVMLEVGQRARQGARLGSETPGLAAYYAQRVHRPDLRCVSLSDQMALKELEPGDFIVAARGRRYFSNQDLLFRLQQSTTPAFQVYHGGPLAADVYILDQASLAIIANTK
jgi:hypothetical protein